MRRQVIGRVWESVGECSIGEKMFRTKARTSPAGRRRGRHDGCFPFAGVAIMLAIAQPIFMRVFEIATRDGASPVRAVVQATVLTGAAVAAVFGLLPLAAALPWACFVTATRRRTEPFREVLAESWVLSLAMLLGLFCLFGLGAMIWDMAIWPAIEHLKS